MFSGNRVMNILKILKSIGCAVMGSWKDILVDSVHRPNRRKRFDNERSFSEFTDLHGGDFFKLLT